GPLRRGMVTRGFFALLALLRIAAGLSLLTSGLQKLAWFGSTTSLDQKLADWAQHPANGMVAKYVAFATAHHGLFARLVVLGELSLGALLILGFLTPLAALLAFAMVLQFQLASGQIFSMGYLRGQSGLAYLLIYPVLFFGRAGTAVGVGGCAGQLEHFQRVVARNGPRGAEEPAHGARAAAAYFFTEKTDQRPPPLRRERLGVELIAECGDGPVVDRRGVLLRGRGEI